jgi:hypothetical protein
MNKINARNARRRTQMPQIWVRLCASVTLWAAISLFVNSWPLRAKAPKLAREEGKFKIFFSGKEIGSERFVIIGSDESASSSSILDFRNPGDQHQGVHIESKLEMGPRYVPKDYQLTSNVDGKKGLIHAEFSPHQVMFEFTGGGTSQKSGLLIGNDCTLLDTNIFHHFIFLARLYKSGSREKTQHFEVVIPQERDNGRITLAELGSETLAMNGKKIEARRIKVDSGSVQINLWVDGDRILQRIAVPSRQIDVFRSP